MKNRLLLVPLLLALVAALAACGGGGGVPANAVAVVNGTPITTADFNAWLSSGLALTKPKPHPGSPQYISVRTGAVSRLVLFEEVNQAAAKLGISVTPAEVNKYLADYAKTHNLGTVNKLLAQFKLTLAQAQAEALYALQGQKIQKKVEASAKVTPAEEKKYYDTNRATYMTPATVKVAASKQLANTIEQKLRNGASFAKLAKQYSQDPGSASQGGKYTVTGNEVPAYLKAALSLKTGELSAPIDATSTANGGFGFFIIKALGPVKKTGNPPQKTRSVEHILVAVKTKPKPQSFAEAQATIHQALLSQAQQQLWQQYLSDFEKSFQGKIKYQPGYAPPATTALPTTTG